MTAHAWFWPTASWNACVEGGCIAPAGSPQQTRAPALVIAQANSWPPTPPAADTFTCLKRPAGGTGTGDPGYPVPQQAIVASVRIPQLNPRPVLICQNVPPGGDDCPKLLSPQHATTPSVLMPHVSKKPASRARLLNVPAWAVL